MAVAKRPKQKPTRSDNRKIKSAPSKKKVELDEDEEAELKRKRRRKKKLKEKAEAEKQALTQVLGKDGAKRVRMTNAKLEALNELNSEFKLDLPDIFNLVDNPEASAEELQKAYLKAAFASIVNLIPLMEASAHKKQSESGAYALNALLSQGREIASELRALQSSDEVSHRIATLVIQPMFTALVNVLVQSLSNIRSEIEPLIKESKDQSKMREIFQKHSVSLGAYLDVSRQTTTAKIEEMIE